MDPLTMMLIGGGASAILGGLSAKDAQEQMKKDQLLNSQIARYQPWSGASQVAVTKAPTTMQGVLQGGMGGASFGLGLSKSLKKDALLDKLLDSPNSNKIDPGVLALMNNET